MTTRKLKPLCGLLACLILVGCSTPGPLHLYSISENATSVHDFALGNDDPARDVPSFLSEDDRVTGFAYDPYTDHFFLRLAPGNHIRVVDRPARKMKSEFVIRQLPSDGGGDLAVSPRTGHMFFTDRNTPDVSVANRYGEYLERISLAGRTAPAAAIAFDMEADQLLVLGEDGVTIDRYTLSGAPAGSIALSQRVRASLAYDSVAHEIYAPLDDAKVGVFSADGRLERTIHIAPGDRFIDVGPHSFLRVF